MYLCTLTCVCVCVVCCSDLNGNVPLRLTHFNSQFNNHVNKPTIFMSKPALPDGSAC